MKDEITPKNIIMIGPTGVGKTEIARRLAKLVNAPFIKVEATKYTEVGYVGRDVESMVRDLVTVAIQMVKEREMARVREKATDAVNERLLDAIYPESKSRPSRNAYELFIGGRPANQQPQNTQTLPTPENLQAREDYRRRLLNGELEDMVIELEVTDNSSIPIGVIGQNGDDTTMNVGGILQGLLPQ